MLGSLAVAMTAEAGLNFGIPIGGTGDPPGTTVTAEPSLAGIVVALVSI